MADRVRSRDRRADLVFVDGPVTTMDRARSSTDAVAVRDGRILALGLASVRGLISSSTDVVRIGNRLLLPGFLDAHVHPVYGGLRRLRCDLTESADAAECLRRVGEYVRGRPAVGWVLGGGWELSQFAGDRPRREHLDAVTGDRPAFLVQRDQHSVWVNTAALRLANVDRDTPDPPDGRIERDADEAPSGVLHEGAADLVGRVLPTASDREYQEGLLEGQRVLHAHGVTGWHDAIIGRYLGYGDILPTYLEADRQGLLTGRVRGALWWDRARGDEQVPELVRRRERARGQRFRADAVKIMQDGVCESRTAAMVLPYLGGLGRGLSFLDAEARRTAVRRLDAEGFQIHFHAVGDRAVAGALDALAGARQAHGGNDSRHQISHAQVLTPSDISRFRSLGVVATIQPRWAVNDVDMVEFTVPYLGHRRAGWQYPFRSLRDAGAVLAAGSDWPVSDVDPMRGVHAAVNRTDPETDDDPFLPEQALPLVDALAAYTINSAWVNHLDGQTGSIEPGKHADLVLLDRDPFTLPPEKIGQAQVDMTVVGGQVVYERGP